MRRYVCRECATILDETALLALPDDDCPTCGAVASFDEVDDQDQRDSW